MDTSTLVLGGLAAGAVIVAFVVLSQKSSGDKSVVIETQSSSNSAKNSKKTGKSKNSKGAKDSKDVSLSTTKSVSSQPSDASAPVKPVPPTTAPVKEAKKDSKKDSKKGIAASPVPEPIATPAAPVSKVAASAEQDGFQEVKPNKKKDKSTSSVPPSAAVALPAVVPAAVESKSSEEVSKKAKKKKKDGESAAAAAAPEEDVWEKVVDKKKLAKENKELEKLQQALAAPLSVEQAPPTAAPPAKKTAVPPASTSSKASIAVSVSEEPAAAASAPASNSVTFDVDPKHFAKIIGKGGATLKLFQEKTSAKIDMPRRDSLSNAITISGSDEAIAAARKNIEMLCDKGFCPLTDPDTVSASVSIPSKSKSLLIGEKGSNLRALQDAFKVRINLSQKDEESVTAHVTILGDMNSVKLAKTEIKTLVTEGFSASTHPTWIKTLVEFPEEKFGILIGPKGHTIKSIQGNNKPCKINLPDKGSGAPVSVLGPPQQVAHAIQEIQRLLIVERSDENGDSSPPASPSSDSPVVGAAFALSPSEW